MESPYYWEEARRAAETADVILCLGTSLKVLRKYLCLWCMDRQKNSRPRLYIVNLQWTPKDEMSELKINGEYNFDALACMVHSTAHSQSQCIVHSTPHGKSQYTLGTILCPWPIAAHCMAQSQHTVWSNHSTMYDLVLPML